MHSAFIPSFFPFSPSTNICSSPTKARYSAGFSVGIKQDFSPQELIVEEVVVYTKKHGGLHRDHMGIERKFDSWPE